MIKALKLFTIGIGYTIAAVACPFLGWSMMLQDFESCTVFTAIVMGSFLIAEGIRKSMIEEQE